MGGYLPLILLLLFFPILVQAQFANFSYWGGRPIIWTWMGGTLGYSNNAGVYGTKGTPSTTNIPRARSFACGDKDASGNLWLFGGHNRTNGDYVQNDLWRFNPTTLEWTWMSGDSGDGMASVPGTKGVPSTSNYPGGLTEPTCWFDDNGYFWVFGGYFDASNNYNTLWRFNPSTSEWTWMTGVPTSNDPGNYGTKGVPASTNTPSCRERSGGWKGPGNTFYIYGGYDNSAGGRKSDLWKYDHGTNQWTWIFGPTTIAEAPVFGTKGVEAASNTPGARRTFQGTTAVDDNGDLWMFGGDNSSANSYGDLWRYRISTGYWTWMAGSSTVNYAGSFGTLGVPSATASPPNKKLHFLLYLRGVFHIFGGFNSSGDWNDFWTYYPISGLWAWRSGSSTINPVTVSGTLSVPAASNVPGGRDSFVRWIDNQGRIWIFGGETGASQKTTTELWMGVPY